MVDDQQMDLKDGNENYLYQLNHHIEMKIIENFLILFSSFKCEHIHECLQYTDMKRPLFYCEG